MLAHNVRIALRLALFCAVCSAAACGGSSAGSSVAGKTTALRGVVTDGAGTPLAGVTVSAGSVSASSDASGRYELRAPAGKARVRFALTGYVDGFRSPTLLDGTPTQLNLTLLTLSAAMPLDAAVGGMLTGMRGAAVKVPADAFVDPAGKPVTGMVDVYLTPLDPSRASERGAAPEFVAEQADGPSLLESFGMVDISVRKGDQKLSVAPGKALELSIPVPDAAKPEPTIGLWSFDETKSIWVSEGEATYDAATRTYVGMAKHMSLWNCDQPYTATCVCGVVTEKGGSALAGARVEANGTSYVGQSASQTDRDGKFCIAVRKDSDIDVVAYHASTGGKTKSIRSGSTATDVPARIGDARCQDIGSWEVTKDVFVDSTGASTRCGDVANPFANGCAADLGAVFGGCYMPQGECTTSSEAGGSTTRYANGCYSEGDASGTRFYSTTGKLCATTTFDATSSSNISIQYVLPDMRAFTLSLDGAGGDFVIKCPDGKETRVTTEQRAALQACSSPDGMASSAQSCKIEGATGGDAGIAIPTACTKDTDCGKGTVCCAIPNDTTKICFADSTCKLIQQQR